MVLGGSIVPDDTRDKIVEIYRCCFGGIFGYCARRLYRKDLAEDAASDVFVRLVEEYPSLKDKSRQQIRYWLYGTARNVVAAFLRDSTRRKAIAEGLAQERQKMFSADQHSDVRIDWPVVYEALLKLDSHDQDIIVLRFFEGLETSAIAEILGIKHVTVRVGLSRALKKLAHKLQKAFYGPQ